MLVGRSEELLSRPPQQRLKGKVQLVFTSPPFPLNRKKRYGNEEGEAYKEWLADFGPLFREYLSDSGSLAMEMGNAWVPGEPAMSTLALESLLALKERGDFHLCQEFVWYNPARLPSPAQWVNVERIRVKDSFTRLWWLSATTRPKADNRRVLVEYSDSMKRLLRTRKYNAGERPSEHNIGEESFLCDHGGAIPPNVITAANTRSNTRYRQYCADHGLEIHPARMPRELPSFFIRFLTEPGDLVLDPFAGSNTTGQIAEELGRQWLAIEAEPGYTRGAIGRFERVTRLGRGR